MAATFTLILGGGIFLLTYDLVYVHSFLHFSINHTPVANTCARILSEEGLIGRICQLCGCIGPIHIQSEGSRLLAALTKYCRSPGNADYYLSSPSCPTRVLVHTV